MMQYEDEFLEEEYNKANPPVPYRKQVAGNHYNKHNIQVWDIIDEYGLDYYKGNILKYVLRNKMDVYQDMEKAQHYIEKWLEVNKGLKHG